MPTPNNAIARIAVTPFAVGAPHVITDAYRGYAPNDTPQARRAALQASTQLHVRQTSAPPPPGTRHVGGLSIVTVTGSLVPVPVLHAMSLGPVALHVWALEARGLSQVFFPRLERIEIHITQGTNPAHSGDFTARATYAPGPPLPYLNAIPEDEHPYEDARACAVFARATTLPAVNIDIVPAPV